MSGATIARDGTTSPPPPSGPEQPGHIEPPRPGTARQDLWPRTDRWLPWLIALFLAMLWLVPIDSIEARFSFPFDPKLDRIVLGVIFLVWVTGILAGGRATPRWRAGPLDALVVVFMGVALLSVVLNALVLANLDEFDLAVKKLGLLTSYVTFFFIVATSLRPRELSRFALLFVVLACVTAVGTLNEYWTDRNVFYEWWEAIVPAGAFDFRPELEGNRFATPPVLGPARHPLALAAMFGMALSFAVVGIARSVELRRKCLYGVAFVLILGAVFATSRKTGTFATVGAVTALLVLRPRQILRLAPAAFAIFVIAFLVAPRAVEHQIERLEPSRVSAGASSEGRKSDYEAINPDLRENLAFGRGYGAYDPNKYRILDNNYLVLLLETGLVGAVVFLGLIIAVPLTARRAARARDPGRWSPALAAAGGAAAFGVSMALFDAMAFAQAPYMFFFLGGIAAVSRAADAEWVEAGPSAAKLLGEREGRRPAPPAGSTLRGHPEPAPRSAPGEHAGGRRRRRGPGWRTTVPPTRRAGRAPAPSGSHGTNGRPRGAPRRRRRATALVTVALIGLGISALGRGGEEPLGDTLEAGGGGGGNDPFAAVPPADRGSDRGQRSLPERPAVNGTQRPQPGAFRSRSSALISTSASAPGSGTHSGGAGGVAGGPGGDGGRPQKDTDQKPSGPGEKPDKPEQPDSPSPEKPKDCLPGDIEVILAEIGTDACSAPLSLDRIEARVLSARRAGRISAKRAATIIASLSQSTTKPSRTRIPPAFDKE